MNITEKTIFHEFDNFKNYYFRHKYIRQYN